MPVYFLTGTLGAGKTLASVSMIAKRFRRGGKLATNLDINLDKLLPLSSKSSYVRLPDKPSIDDFHAIGRGSEDVDENTYGLLVLDELGTWLNSRSWNDKARQPVLDWFLHARKLGWDIVFVVQNIDLIDKQARDALCEYLVIARRLDRLPFFQVFMPRFHVATVYYGNTVQSPKVDRWFYQGKQLYDAYDTRQVFSASYEHAAFSQLSNWHLIDRYKPPAAKFNFSSFLRRHISGYVSGLLSAVVVVSTASGFVSGDIAEPAVPVSISTPAPVVDPVLSIEPLGDLHIVGSVGNRYIFNTSSGHQTSRDLVGMGYTVSYVRPCLARLSQGTSSFTVTCSASLPSPQGAVVMPEGVAGLF